MKDRSWTVAFLLTGFALALLAGFISMNLLFALKLLIPRQWLYNINIAPLNPVLLAVAMVLIGISSILIARLIQPEIRGLSRPQFILIVILFWLLLIPFKNSSFPHSLFFSLAGLASVLIWKGSAGAAGRSGELLGGFWKKVMQIPAGPWQALIVCAGIGFYLLSSLWLAQRIPHIIDEVDYLFQAKIFSRAKLWAPLPGPFPFFHFVNMIEKDGKWLSQYTPGWPALLSLGVLLKAPWAVNPIIGGALLLLIYRLARELFGEEPARISSLLALFSPYLIVMNSTMMSHTSCATACLLFLLLLWQTLERKSGGRAFLATFFLGLAVTIRPYTAFLIALPGAAMVLLEIIRSRGRTLRLAVFFLLGPVIPLALLFYYNYLTTGHTLVFGYQYLYGKTIALGFGSRQFPHPHALLEGLRMCHSRLLALSQNLLELAVPALVIAVLPFLLRKIDKKTVWLGATFLSLPLGYIFYFFQDLYYQPRFLFESSAALLILCGLGISLAAREWKNPSLGRYFLVLVLLALLIFIPVRIFSSRRAGDVGRELIREIETQHINNSLVLIQELYYPMGMMLQSPFLDGDNIYVRELKGQEQTILDSYPGRRAYRFYRDPKTGQFTLQPFKPGS